MDYLKLPLTFDQQLLVSDAAKVRADEWLPHFNTGFYEGDWSGVALLSPDGSESGLFTNPDIRNTMKDTPILRRCPYLRSVLEAFQCPLKSARLLRLAPGSAVLEHRDYNLSVADGTARVHIPVCTNPELDFRVNGRRLVMKEGEAWYINFNLPHRLRNFGKTERIHLVVDCEVNDWFAGFFPAEALAPAPVSSIIEFEDGDRMKIVESMFHDFRHLVLEDLNLQKRLKETEGLPEFCAVMLEIASDRGFYFTEADIRKLYRDRRREWQSKWR